jgi:histone-lysine N-methyltransferase SETMAR
LQKSAGKFLASIFFWDQDSILLIDYLPKGQTINAVFYLSLLVQLKDISKEKKLRESHLGGLVLARQCTGLPRTYDPEKMAYLGFQCLDHPPYSPDLAPSDYHLFLGLKKHLKGRHFSSDTEVIAAAETWLNRQSSELFLVTCKRWSNGLRSVLSFVGSTLNKSRVWSL